MLKFPRKYSPTAAEVIETKHKLLKFPINYNYITQHNPLAPPKLSNELAITKRDI